MQRNSKKLWKKIIVFNKLFLIARLLNLNKTNNGMIYKGIKLLELKMEHYVDSKTV
jgi:hypothetical protein